MKRELVQFCLILFVLVFGGAGEELAPKFLGAGVPLLLSATAWFATTRKPLVVLLFALVAGAAEDALSGLPPLLSISFFVAMAGLLRGFKLPLPWALPGYCAYQLWLWIWLGNAVNGSVFLRFVIAVPLGAVTLAAVAGICSWLDEKGAVDEK